MCQETTTAYLLGRLEGRQPSDAVLHSSHRVCHGDLQRRLVRWYLTTHQQLWIVPWNLCHETTTAHLIDRLEGRQPSDAVLHSSHRVRYGDLQRRLVRWDLTTHQQLWIVPRNLCQETTTTHLIDRLGHILDAALGVSHTVLMEGTVAAILWVSWGPDPSPSASVGIQMCTDPQRLVPCCYTWSVIHSISSTDSG